MCACVYVCVHFPGTFLVLGAFVWDGGGDLLQWQVLARPHIRPAFLTRLQCPCLLSWQIFVVSLTSFSRFFVRHCRSMVNLEARMFCFE